MDDIDTVLRPRAPRKNLFLVASIRAPALSAAVRIRNLSETGALIEAPALPRVGERFRLVRQEVEIEGDVVWRAGNRAGVRFEGRISTDDWVSGKCLCADAIAGQAPVDSIQERIRPVERLEDAPLPAATKADSDVLIDARIAEELGYVGRLLEAIGDALSNDAVLLQRHGTTLQNFDLACQILGHLNAVTASADREQAIDRVAMTDLRNRLARKPLFTDRID